MLKNMELPEKKKVLVDLIGKMGLSRSEFARRWIWETQETDDEKQIRSFEETFKKQLKRATTNEQKIEGYLDFLFLQPEARHLDLIKPFGDAARDGDSDAYFEISKSLSRKLSRKRSLPEYK